MEVLWKRAERATVLTLASGGFISYIPVWLMKRPRNTGAGLVGSFWGVALLSWLPLETGPQIAVWLGALAMSLAVSDAAEEIFGVKDDQRIVIDEFIGYWTAILFLPRSIPSVFAAFVLFRFFDAWKPLGIRYLSNLPGGWGVVMDDIAAGVLANLVLRILGIFLPI